VVARSELIRLVWGPQAQDWPATVEQLVTDYVSHLRGPLGRAGAGVRLVSRAPGFVAELDAQLVDWHRFRELCRQARAAREAGEDAAAVRLLRAAFGLWRGPPLADLPGRSLDPGPGSDERAAAGRRGGSRRAGGGRW
jgi:Bacterial transcriptional activator domain